MKILISGANGLIGSAIVKSLESDGHEVLRLVRSAPQNGTQVHWQPESGAFAPHQRDKILGVDAVIHLAGEPIFGRWNEEKKRKIRESRIKSTLLLSETLAGLPRPPAVFISTSAVGYYGYRDKEELTEESTLGQGFLADVCRDWEAAAEPARQAGIRVVHPRLGIVLAKHGGALKQMLLPFKLGLGGPLGSGTQYMSWITLPDVVRGMRFVLDNTDLSGPVNFTTPEPVTNRVFTNALARAVNRPAIIPLPAFILRLVMGREAANETLLTSQRAIPEKLAAHGFKFQHPQIETALKQLLD